MSLVNRLLVAVALLITILAGTAAHTLASGGARFGLQPVTSDKNNPATKSYFVFDAIPGATVENQVRVVNSGTAAGTVRLYAVDATTGQTSGTVFLDAAAPRQDAGGWIALAVSELTLQPGESAVVPFRVTIPAGARAGQHVGGIVAQDLALQEGETQRAGPKNAGFRVDVQNLTILAVQLNLPGPAVDRVEVTGITTGGARGYQQLLVGLQNSGTQMVKPSGSLVVTDAQGREVQRLELKLDTFLPQTAIQYPVSVQQRALGAGTYHARVELAYGASGTTTHEQDFTITDSQVAQVFQSTAPLAAPSMPAQAGAAQPSPQATSGGSPVAGLVRQALTLGLVLALGSVGTLLIGRIARRRGNRAS
ncbi:MAG: DUF916 domain-containing protein [Chloroflexia bacterium]